MQNRLSRTRLAFAGASLLGAVIVSGALADDPPVTVPSTGEEPVGTVTLPTPIWEAVEPGEIFELPSTGVGSAA